MINICYKGHLDSYKRLNESILIDYKKNVNFDRKVSILKRKDDLLILPENIDLKREKRPVNFARNVKVLFYVFE